MSQSESGQERTEQPTPKRLLDARRKGDVARSRELTTMIVMLSGSVLLLINGGDLAERLTQVLHNTLTFTRADLDTPNFLVDQFVGSIWSGLTSLFPLLVVVTVAAIFGAVALGGWSFSASALAFKGERLNALKGLKRIFGVKGLVELAKALAKFGLVAVFAAFWLSYLYEDLKALSYSPTGPGLLEAGWLCLQSLLLLSLTLILIAAVDVPFQLWQHAKKLRMTRQEVRDEQKETDGRPEVKSRIRALQQQTANARMMDSVADADVVITNPTHYAVAVQYDADSMAAPKVVAKGRGEIARRIRELAAEHKVPLFSAPPLARVLYRTVKVGREIPYDLYKAVAQVLAYVMQVADFIAGRGPHPSKPTPDVDETQFGPQATRGGS